MKPNIVFTIGSVIFLSSNFVIYTNSYTIRHEEYLLSDYLANQSVTKKDAEQQQTNKTEVSDDTNAERERYVKYVLDSLDPTFNLLEENVNEFVEKDLSIPKNMTEMNVWFSWMDLEEKFLDRFIKRILPAMFQGNVDIEISRECQAVLIRSFSEFRAGKVWPLLFLDATGKPHGSIFSGKTAFIGSYDNCLDISVDLELEGSMLIKGQYCMMGFQFPIPSKPPKNVKFSVHTVMKELTTINLSKATRGELIQIMTNFGYIAKFYNHFFPLAGIGLCVPSACTGNDVENIFNNIVGDKYRLKTKVIECQTDEVHWSSLQIAMGIILATLGFFVVVATTLDFCSGSRTVPSQKEDDGQEKKRNETYNQSKIFTILQPFSAKKNTAMLLPTPSTSLFDPLHGIKACMMFWIVLGHVYNFNLLDTLKAENMANFGKMIRDHFLVHGLINSVSVVDTFFLITALLVYFNFQKQKSYVLNDGILKFSANVLLMRYLRLIPGVLGIICLVIMLPSLVRGPAINQYNKILNGEECTSEWWKNLLAINNYFQITETCVPHTWYIAVDLQLLALLLIPIYISLKHPKTGAFLIFSIALTCFGILFYLAVIKYNVYDFITSWGDDITRRNYDEISRLSHPFVSQIGLFTRILHLHATSHAISYALGILLAYLIFHYKDNIKLSKVVQIVLWVISVGTLLLVFYGTFSWKRFYFIPPSSHFYGVAIGNRPAWCIASAWIIYACVSGRGGILASFFSWKALVPLSRLSYSVYLIHEIVIQSRMVYRRTAFSWTHYNFVFEAILCSVLSTICAFLFYLIVEAPFNNMSKLLFSNFLQPKKSASNNFAPSNQEIKLQEHKEISLPS